METCLQEGYLKTMEICLDSVRHTYSKYSYYIQKLAAAKDKGSGSGPPPQNSG